MLGTLDAHEAGQGLAQLRRHQQHGGLAGQLLALRGFGEPLLQPLGEPGLEAGARCAGVAVSELCSSRSSSGSSVMTGSSPAMPGDVLHDLAAERDAHVALQRGRVRRARRMLGQRLDDRAHVADRHALGEQALQHAHHGRQRQHARHEILDELRRASSRGC